MVSEKFAAGMVNSNLNLDQKTAMAGLSRRRELYRTRTLEERLEKVFEMIIHYKSVSANRSAAGDFISYSLGTASATPPASFCFTRTTVIFEKPSSNVGAFNLPAIFRMISSGTARPRRWCRSMHTSSGTSKNNPCTSYP